MESDSSLEFACPFLLTRRFTSSGIREGSWGGGVGGGLTNKSKCSKKAHRLSGTMASAPRFSPETVGAATRQQRPRVHMTASDVDKATWGTASSLAAVQSLLGRRN